MNQIEAAPSSPSLYKNALTDAGESGCANGSILNKVQETTKGLEYPLPVLVSIIIPAFNRAAFLAETIESILSQDYSNIETIVLDDGSTDNTQEVLNRYASRLYSLRHDNMGENRTVNRGLEESRGAIICVVNSDDPLLPGAVTAAVEYLNDHPNVLAAYPDWIEIDAEGNRLDTFVLPQYDIHNMLLNFEVALGPGVFIRRRALEFIGMRNASLRYTGDLDYWFRLSLRGQLGHIPLVLATHRSHPGAASSSAKGRVMAGELIQLVDTAFSSGYLPPDLLQRRHRIYAFAHAVALNYFGQNRQGVWRHRLLGLFHAVRSREPEALYIWTPDLYKNLRARIYLFRDWLHRRMEVIKSQQLKWSAHAMGAIIRFLWLARHLFSVSSEQVHRLRIAFVFQAMMSNRSERTVAVIRLLGRIPSDDYRLMTAHTVLLDETSSPSMPLVLLPDEPGERLWLRGDIVGALSLLVRVCFRGWCIADRIRAYGCKVVVAGAGDLIDLPAAAMACTLTRVPLVIYLTDDYLSLWALPTKILRVILVMEQVLYDKAAAVIVSNETLGDELLRRHGVTCSVVRNSVSMQTISNPTATSGKMPLKSNVLLICSISAVNHLNDAAYRTLITAMRRISEPSPQLKIYTQDLPATLGTEWLCDPAVQVRPALEPDKITSSLENADVLFIGFSFEQELRSAVRTSAPVELGDYLASGRPILALVPPDSFIARYLTDFRCGLVVDQDDPDAVADGLNRLFYEHGLAAGLVANALERAREEFAQGVSSRRFMSVVEEAC